MAVLRAFRAIRPCPALAGQVAALPYDVMNSDEARALVQGNPYSFLHVDKAEVDLDRSIPADDEQVYAKAKENLDGLISRGILLQDARPCFYLYRLTWNGRSQTGVAGCTAIDDYTAGVIKKHELTREDKELDRIKHIDRTNANTGPIFLTYREKDDTSRVHETIRHWTETREPVYDFAAEDGIRHEAWVIADDEEIDLIAGAFDRISSLYIADGHHRNAAAVKVGLMRRAAQGGSQAEYNFTLSVIFPDSQLQILDYNRVIRDLNGLRQEEFLEKTAALFDVKRLGGAEKPARKHVFSLYLDHTWYALALKNPSEPADPAAGLDVSILQNMLLAPVLGIGDPRTDKRIDFVGGMRGLAELTKRVDSGEMAAAFALFPTSIEELMSIADAGQLMPPKSTWFEPKLRSGLFIHSLA